MVLQGVFSKKLSKNGVRTILNKIRQYPIDNRFPRSSVPNLNLFSALLRQAVQVQEEELQRRAPGHLLRGATWNRERIGGL